MMIDHSHSKTKYRVLKIQILITTHLSLNRHDLRFVLIYFLPCSCIERYHSDDGLLMTKRIFKIKFYKKIKDNLYLFKFRQRSFSFQ
jgi:hypothetical protein